MPATAQGKPGTFTREALMKKSREQKEHREQLAKAVALVADGKSGGSYAVARLVVGCNRKQIEYAIQKAQTLKTRLHQRPAWSIMTEIEVQRLVAWLGASAANDNPAMENEVSEQVVKMLQCRRLAHRKAKGTKSPTDAR